MKSAKIALLSCASIILSLVSAPPSFSGVKIELRNGGNITADSCSESGTSLLCYKMGGSFSIDRRDIASMKTTEGSVADEDAGPSPEAAAKSVTKEDAENSRKASTDDAGAAQKPPAGRLEEIGKRKSELVNERENLVRERLRLQEDTKKAPDWMLPERYDELNKRNADIDARIKRFNEEVKELNDEEKKIRGKMTPKTQGSAESSGAEVAPAEQ
jgi:hypothetical protein